MTKNIVVTALVALVVSLGAVFATKTNQSNLSGLSERDIQAVSLRVGPSGAVAGSKFSFVKAGTCTLLANFSIASSTSANVDCAVTGVKSGDIVYMQLNASTTMASQYIIRGVKASTTAGYITASLFNISGAAAIPAATNGFGSSTPYFVFRSAN